MIGGARIAPTDDPLLKIPEANERSSAGNHSATTFTAAGQLPASPIPSRKRNTPSDSAPRANACNSAHRDHQPTNSAYPARVPSRSIITPEKPFMMV